MDLLLWYQADIAGQSLRRRCTYPVGCEDKRTSDLLEETVSMAVGIRMRQEYWDAPWPGERGWFLLTIRLFSATDMMQGAPRPCTRQSCLVGGVGGGGGGGRDLNHDVRGLGTTESDIYWLTYV